ncbi:hypothetical protein GUJ93_ZPchr0003g18279 [Zizania palustris]|uniref:Uncharacterized protein n=1 Tax=Zizania palustris TaxID=103762 RepID=A0A8J5S702_ZIZPA|nr:hypothetical protein GUJ93_ZPchr0003g18279 [Zizania palustris]
MHRLASVVVVAFTTLQPCSPIPPCGPGEASPSGPVCLCPAAPHTVSGQRTLPRIFVGDCCAASTPACRSTPSSRLQSWVVVVLLLVPAAHLVYPTISRQPGHVPRGPTPNKSNYNV